MKFSQAIRAALKTRQKGKGCTDVECQVCTEMLIVNGGRCVDCSLYNLQDMDGERDCLQSSYEILSKHTKNTRIVENVLELALACELAGD